MEAFRRGRLKIRDDLHLGVGFLAATSGMTGPERLELGRVAHRARRDRDAAGGHGDPVLLLHGLGATKASFLPTVAALAGSFRVIAIDLPGFGDSAMPVGAAYDPPFFARAVVGLLDALEIERAHLVGNSMGGRVALELGFEHPERVGRLALLAPVAGVAARAPLGAAAARRPAGARADAARAAGDRRADRPRDGPRRQRRLERGRRRRVPARLSHPARPRRVLRRRPQHLPRGPGHGSGAA